MTQASKLSASSSQNSLTNGSSGECQTVARFNLGPEVAASSSQKICVTISKGKKSTN